MSKTVNTAIELDEGLLARLTALSALKERPPGRLMAAAIEEYVAREEQHERERAEDMERWQSYERTGVTVPHAAVEKWLSSWGSEDELPCPK